MKNKILPLLAILLSALMIFTGCSKEKINNNNANKSSEKIKIVTTTTMLKDLIQEIGGDAVEVEGLMGEGVDPHLYTATASDVNKLKAADVIIYQGLHLEGKMANIFSELKDKKIIEASKSLDKAKLLKDEEGQVDPHIWFDVTLWGEVGEYINKELGKMYPTNKEKFEKNYVKYQEELAKLDKYIVEKVATLPEEKRVLVTAHDAFSYFSKKYGFKVSSIQGISTDSEATTSDIEKIADEVAKLKIKAIFIESAVPEKTINSLKAAVKAKGHEVEIGGELYADSLGDEKNKTETYIKTVKANVDLIVNSLK